MYFTSLHFIEHLCTWIFVHKYTYICTFFNQIFPNVRPVSRKSKSPSLDSATLVSSDILMFLPWLWLKVFFLSVILHACLQPQAFLPFSQCVEVFGFFVSSGCVTFPYQRHSPHPCYGVIQRYDLKLWSVCMGQHIVNANILDYHCSSSSWFCLS